MMVRTQVNFIFKYKTLFDLVNKIFALELYNLSLIQLLNFLRDNISACECEANKNKILNKFEASQVALFLDYQLKIESETVDFYLMLLKTINIF